jgi:hypothetical protein
MYTMPGVQMRWFTGAATSLDKLYAGANQHINEVRLNRGAG